jgi:undecaprenyl diphosphate synthase
MTDDTDIGDDPHGTPRSRNTSPSSWTETDVGRRQRGQPRHAGHRSGINSVRSTIEVCIEHGVKALTLFAFSSENWRRPPHEVKLLMELFMTALQREFKRMQSHDIRLRVLGRYGALPDSCSMRIHASKRRPRTTTAWCCRSRPTFGGRWEIVQAARHWPQRSAPGASSQNRSTRPVREHTTTGDMPEPDLFIRTGGEHRISNFLLWHCAYSELYFTPVYWPDFDATQMRLALEQYMKRQRRFGRTAAQLVPKA